VGSVAAEGAWRTGWLPENRSELAGEACVIGEPQAPSDVRIGEKG